MPRDDLDRTTMDGLSTPQPGALRSRDAAFRSLNKLLSIASEFATVHSLSAKDMGDALGQPVPLAFAEAKYIRLLQWMQTLRDDMHFNHGSPPNVTLFHMLFHVVVGKLFYPFIGHPQKFRLRSLAAHDSFPRTIHAVSMKQLQRLLFRYRAKHGEPLNDPLVSTVLAMVCSTALTNQDDPHWRYYFMLCMHSWRSLFVAFPVIRDVMRAYLSMALEKEAISGAEARHLLRKLDEAGSHHPRDSIHEAYTTWMLDFDQAAGEPMETPVHSMAMKFEELVLFDDLTEGDFVPARHA